MWTCPRCGEPNEDTFRECWNCLSVEMEQQVTAAPPPPPAPPCELRSVGSVLLYVALGFFVGMMLGVAVFHRGGTSLAEASIGGAVVGSIFAIIVGVFVWVVFPFKPMEASSNGADERADDD